MNQILYKSFLDSSNNINLKSKNKKISLIIIILSIIFIIVSIIFYIIIRIRSNTNEKTSKKLISNYNIMTLYSNVNESNNLKNLDNRKQNTDIINFIAEEQSEPFVIGIIEINKINISYPILSTVNDDLLKIAPCRFYGPMPNEIGNLCIAGHNNANNTQFGKLNQLNLSDHISIYDLNGIKKNYMIYSKFEIDDTDFSCTNQDTFGLRIITLITCNNISGKRICLKATEIK